MPGDGSVKKVDNPNLTLGKPNRVVCCRTSARLTGEKKSTTFQPFFDDSARVPVKIKFHSFKNIQEEHKTMQIKSNLKAGQSGMGSMRGQVGGADTPNPNPGTGSPLNGNQTGTGNDPRTSFPTPTEFDPVLP